MQCGDALQLGSNVWFVCGRQVKLCDPLITCGSYLRALEIKGLYIKRYINSYVYFFLSRQPYQRTWCFRERHYKTLNKFTCFTLLLTLQNYSKCRLMKPVKTVLKSTNFQRYLQFYMHKNIYTGCDKPTAVASWT